MSESAMPTDPAAGTRAYELDRRPRLPLLVGAGGPDPDDLRRGSGSWVWDYDGNRYLDFSSQLVNTNIGHQHPKVIAAIQEQAADPGHHRPRSTPTPPAARLRG